MKKQHVEARGTKYLHATGLVAQLVETKILYQVT